MNNQPLTIKTKQIKNSSEDTELTVTGLRLPTYNEAKLICKYNIFASDSLECFFVDSDSVKESEYYSPDEEDDFDYDDCTWGCDVETAGAISLIPVIDVSETVTPGDVYMIGIGKKSSWESEAKGMPYIAFNDHSLVCAFREDKLLIHEVLMGLYDTAYESEEDYKEKMEDCLKFVAKKRGL